MEQMQEFYFKKKYFSSLGGMKQKMIDYMWENYPETYENKSKGGIPIWAMLKCLNKELMKYRGTATQQTKYNAMDEKVAEKHMLLDMEIKHERVIKERITNQTKLNKLIFKDEGEQRVANVINGLLVLVKHAQQAYASRQPNKRQVLQELTECWNECIGYLEEEAENISWAEDGDANLLATRLDRLEEESRVDEEEIELTTEY